MKSAEISGLPNRAMVAIMILALAVAGLGTVAAQEPQRAPSRFTYVDLVDLAEASNLVVKAQIRRQATLEPERSPGLQPGTARLYLEAETQALFAGNAAIGESLRLLADFPIDDRGRPQRLQDSVFVFFGREVSGRPGEIQLLTPYSFMVADPYEEERLRMVLRQMAAPERPPHVTGVREALSIEGNLAGESETQFFLETRESVPVSITVIRRPGMAPQWGVAWSEIVDQSARPPVSETLAWYSLACFLPRNLPPASNLARDEASRTRALQDYNVVLDQLGPCIRNRD